MTSLYHLDVRAQEIAARFGAEAGRDPWDGGYIAPARFAPVIVTGPDSARRIVPRLWGVPPPPDAARMPDARPVTHVRNLESPFWIGTLRHRHLRCLVPATAFPVWADAPDPATGKRARLRFSLPDRPLFAFAGIWRDSEVPSFAILTCEPNRMVGAVSAHTMPVILHREAEDDWLRADWARARRLVAPYPSQLMAMDAAPSPRTGGDA